MFIGYLNMHLLHDKAISSGYLPSEYFRDASIGDLEDARDVARPGTRVGQLDDLLSGRVRQRSAVDVNSTQLIDAAMP